MCTLELGISKIKFYRNTFNDIMNKVYYQTSRKLLDIKKTIFHFKKLVKK